MVNLLISVLFLFISLSSSPYSFEGTINLTQKSLYDTNYLTYSIKKENIRIDKYDNNKVLIQSMLVNLEKEEIYILSPAKKLYKKLELSGNKDIKEDMFIIQKTGNSQLIRNKECFQWRVKNVERNTEVAYWVWQNDFYFFEKLVTLLNQTDNTYEFFGRIPDPQGFFPMLTVERTLLRREKSRIYVTDISNNTIEDTSFIIPKDFQLVKS